METATFTHIIGSQFDAALSMLRECIEKSTDDAWLRPVGVYPAWMVAYHVLCYIDCYSAHSDEAWTPDEGPTGIHPLGRKELEAEFPSRTFSRAELLGYLDRCRGTVRGALQRETEASLAGPSGFSWLKFSRAETWAYNLRHAQHHTGQLTAFLRREGIETRWVKAGT